MKYTIQESLDFLDKYTVKRKEMNDMFTKNNTKRKCNSCGAFEVGNEVCGYCGKINPGFNSWMAN